MMVQYYNHYYKEESKDATRYEEKGHQLPIDKALQKDRSREAQVRGHDPTVQKKACTGFC